MSRINSAFLTLLGSLLLSSSSFANSPYPEAIKPCLIKDYEKMDFVGAVESKGADYFLFHFEQLINDPYIENQKRRLYGYLGVKLDKKGCLVVIPPGIKDLTWTKFVEPEIAQKLALAYLSYDIEQAGGKKDFIANLGHDFDAGSQWVFYPEDAWAMQQMGIPLPEPHHVIEKLEDLPDLP